MKYSEEEKKAIEYLKENSLVRLNKNNKIIAYGNSYKYYILKLLEKQQNEIERLYKDNYRLDRENQLKFERAVDTSDYIPKEAIREKIEYYKKQNNELDDFTCEIDALEELLGDE